MDMTSALSALTPRRGDAAAVLKGPVPMPVSSAMGLMGLAVVLALASGLTPFVYPEQVTTYSAISAEVDPVAAPAAVVTATQWVAAAVAVVFVSFWMLSAWFVMRGAAWARTVASIVAVAFIGMAMQGLSAGGSSPPDTALCTAMALTGGAIVMLLWLPRSHRHFSSLDSLRQQYL